MNPVCNAASRRRWSELLEAADPRAQARRDMPIVIGDVEDTVFAVFRTDVFDLVDSVRCAADGTLETQNVIHRKLLRPFERPPVEPNCRLDVLVPIRPGMSTGKFLVLVVDTQRL